MFIERYIVFVLVACSLSCHAQVKKSGHNKSDTGYVYKAPSSGGTGKFYLGREIARVMDASGSDWLERSSRPQEENSGLMVSSMQLKPDQTVADIGAGTGYYTFRVASLVPNGKVYAVEIQDELIRTLDQKKLDSNITNVEVIKGDTLSTNLPEDSIDVAFMVDVYHELSWPREILKSVAKSLKPDGRLILIEYRGEDPELQIKRLHKTTIEQLTRELEANGFTLERRVDDLPIQHFLVFRKS
jgi:precorrin-6B methylase 2